MYICLHSICLPFRSQKLLLHGAHLLSMSRLSFVQLLLLKFAVCINRLRGLFDDLLFGTL